MKRSGGKATRDFKNLDHPEVVDSDYRGPRTIIDGDHKLVMQEAKGDGARVELFDLRADAAERHDLSAKEPERVEELKAKLRAWQDSVLQSLTGADYR